MSAPCPKCGYIRQQSETAPEYECPRCGVVYAKYLEALHARASAREAKHPAADPAPRSYPRKRVAFVVIVMATTAIVYGHKLFTEFTPQRQPVVTSKPALKAPPLRPPPTAAEIEKARIDRLMSSAREACFEAIRARALFPSTVDIAWFSGTVTQRHGAATLVKAAFTSKNAHGAELPYYGQCLVTDTGKLDYYNQEPR